MTLINKGKKMLNKKKETMMGKIDREADEYAELQRKGDAIWNSCRSHASYKAYVLGKLKHYKKEERKKLLMQTDALNDLIESLHAQVDFLFQDTEYVVTRFRVVNDEEQDEDYSGRLGGISGLIEINRADDEGEQVACLEVIAVPGDDENPIIFEFDVENEDCADIQKFNDAAKATEYLHSMVLLENTPGVEDFECGHDPTFH